MPYFGWLAFSIRWRKDANALVFGLLELTGPRARTCARRRRLAYGIPQTTEFPKQRRCLMATFGGGLPGVVAVCAAAAAGADLEERHPPDGQTARLRPRLGAPGVGNGSPALAPTARARWL